MTSQDTNETPESRFTIPPGIWIATLFAVLLLAVSLWQAKKLQSQLSELQGQLRLQTDRKETLEAQRREIDQVRALLAAPETRAWQLKPASSKKPPLTIFWNEELGLLVTSQSALILPSGRELQLWIVVKGGKRSSAGTIHPPAMGNLLELLQPAAPVRMKDAIALSVTIESAAGSSQPSSAPAWTVRIR